MADTLPALPTPLVAGNKKIALNRSDAVFVVGGRPYWLVPAVQDCDVDRFARTGKAEFYRLRVYALTPDPTTTSGYQVQHELWSASDAGQLPSLAYQVAAFRANPASWIKSFRGLHKRLAEHGTESPVEPSALTDIRALRLQLGLTQQTFAARLGVHPVTVSTWETGSSAPSKAARKALERLAAEGAAR